MPFTAPVLNIGQGLADGIMSGTDTLNHAINYVRDQYSNAKSAEGAMKALSTMTGPDGTTPLLPPAVMQEFQKQSPQGQVAMAGMFSAKAQNMWDAQNKISIAQAGAQAEGAQSRQTYEAQLEAIRNAWGNNNPMSADPRKGNVTPVTPAPGTTPATPATPATTPQKAPQGPQMAYAKVGNGYVGFQIGADGKPIPGSGHPVPGIPQGGVVFSTNQ